MTPIQIVALITVVLIISVLVFLVVRDALSGEDDWEEETDRMFKWAAEESNRPHPVETCPCPICREVMSRSKVSRIEVIDENGRSYTKYFDGTCELSYQDQGRTLKIFITPR